MKPAAFDYVRAATGAEAVAALGQLGSEARVLAGGQSLLAALNFRLAEPAVLVDISRAADLAGIRIESGKLVVGAAATQASVEWRMGLANEVPLLAQALPHVAHFPIRNKGTVCGSIAHADPSAELPLVLLACGGDVVLRSRRGSRTLVADDFLQGMLMTAREPDELVECVRFPLARAGERFAFEEFAVRHGDFALASVAVAASAKGLRVAVGGVADRPRFVDLPAGLADADRTTALNDLAWALEARDDANATAAQRRHLVRTLGARAFARVKEGT